MTLQDLINEENILLEFEEKNKFKISFNDYIELNHLLDEIGEITNLYFIYIKDYFNSHKCTEQELEAFNKQLLNEEINFNFDKIFSLKNRLLI